MEGNCFLFDGCDEPFDAVGTPGLICAKGNILDPGMNFSCFIKKKNCVDDPDVFLEKFVTKQPEKIWYFFFCKLLGKK